MSNIFDKDNYLYDVSKEKEKCSHYEMTTYAKDKYKKYYSFYCDEKFSADVMTSGKSRVKQFFDTEGVKDMWEGLVDWDEEMWNRYQCDSGDELLQSIKCFVRVNHTIGNFLLIPWGYFNNAKSGGGHKDHFDYCMFYLKKYYMQSDKDEVLHDWLGKWKASGLIKKCREWLDSFGNGKAGWENFIELNYLQDYVKEYKSIQEYKPIQFKTLDIFDTIEECSLPLPDDIEGWRKWFDNVTELIVKRGFRIMHKREITEDELKMALDKVSCN